MKASHFNKLRREFVESIIRPDLRKVPKTGHLAKICGRRASAQETRKLLILLPFIYESDSQVKKTAELKCAILNRFWERDSASLTCASVGRVRLGRFLPRLGTASMGLFLEWADLSSRAAG